MGTKQIKSFTIKNLFGDRDVKIPFNDEIKILIGENGLGKTTVLNILYYALTDRLHRLRNFNFEQLTVTFEDGQKASLKKAALFSQQIDERDDYFPGIPLATMRQISRAVSPNEIKEFQFLMREGAPQRVLQDRVSYISHQILGGRYPSRIVLEALRQLGGVEYNEKVKTFRQTIGKQLEGIDILYFPTFRRIEEDLINLGFDEKIKEIPQNDSRLIQFGMKDVKDRLDEIKNEINNLSSRGLAQISSEILSQLVKGVPKIDKGTLDKITTKDIDIILARVGEAISKEDKEKITVILSEGKVNYDEDKFLVYFLQKLIEIYEKQREIDSSIENFVSVCNKYLETSNKGIYYEASEVEFYLVSHSAKDKVPLADLLSNLSSGEKQIVSLFAKIFLSKAKDFFVLFDEPELSLSIFWQKRLLSDIVGSGKCRLMLSVTHSPFIFENELSEYAIGLSEYVKLRKI